MELLIWLTLLAIAAILVAGFSGAVLSRGKCPKSQKPVS